MNKILSFFITILFCQCSLDTEKLNGKDSEDEAKYEEEHGKIIQEAEKYLSQDPECMDICKAARINRQAKEYLFEQLEKHKNLKKLRELEELEKIRLLEERERIEKVQNLQELELQKNLKELEKLNIESFYNPNFTKMDCLNIFGLSQKPFAVVEENVNAVDNFLGGKNFSPAESLKQIFIEVDKYLKEKCDRGLLWKVGNEKVKRDDRNSELFNYENSAANLINLFFSNTELNNAQTIDLFCKCLKEHLCSESHKRLKSHLYEKNKNEKVKPIFKILPYGGATTYYDLMNHEFLLPKANVHYVIDFKSLMYYASKYIEHLPNIKEQIEELIKELINLQKFPFSKSSIKDPLILIESVSSYKYSECSRKLYGLLVELDDISETIARYKESKKIKPYEVKNEIDNQFGIIQLATDKAIQNARIAKYLTEQNINIFDIDGFINVDIVKNIFDNSLNIILTQPIKGTNKKSSILDLLTSKNVSVKNLYDILCELSKLLCILEHQMEYVSPVIIHYGQVNNQMRKHFTTLIANNLIKDSNSLLYKILSVVAKHLENFDQNKFDAFLTATTFWKNSDCNCGLLRLLNELKKATTNELAKTTIDQIVQGFQGKKASKIKKIKDFCFSDLFTTDIAWKDLHSPKIDSGDILNKLEQLLAREIKPLQSDIIITNEVKSEKKSTENDAQETLIGKLSPEDIKLTAKDRRKQKRAKNALNIGQEAKILTPEAQEKYQCLAEILVKFINKKLNNSKSDAFDLIRSKITPSENLKEKSYYEDSAANSLSLSYSFDGEESKERCYVGKNILIKVKEKKYDDFTEILQKFLDKKLNNIRSDAFDSIVKRDELLKERKPIKYAPTGNLNRNKDKKNKKEGEAQNFSFTSEEKSLYDRLEFNQKLYLCAESSELYKENKNLIINYLNNELIFCGVKNRIAIMALSHLVIDIDRKKSFADFDDKKINKFAEEKLKKLGIEAPSILFSTLHGWHLHILDNFEYEKSIKLMMELGCDESYIESFMHNSKLCEFCNEILKSRGNKFCTTRLSPKVYKKTEGSKEGELLSCKEVLQDPVFRLIYTFNKFDKNIEQILKIEDYKQALSKTKEIMASISKPCYVQLLLMHLCKLTILEDFKENYISYTLDKDTKKKDTKKMANNLSCLINKIIMEMETKKKGRSL